MDIQYGKYKISLAEDSKRVQGLRVGDIVRRQYFDGANVIYSLMCVLETGTDNPTGRQYFIGALLEGDVPVQGQLLDFVRVTSLRDESRQGALYLTAADSTSPYMDIIDGIGKNKSLSYPVSITSDIVSGNAKSQYIYYGEDIEVSYRNEDVEEYRICRILKKDIYSAGRAGIRQRVKTDLKVGDNVLVSYKARASRNMEASATFGGLNKDCVYSEQISTEWKYCLKNISIDFSGNIDRDFDLGFDGVLRPNDWVEIAELNIITLASVSNFGDASQTRIGRIDGVVDDVFGELKGYGAYAQKLYATNSAHISGTLTAGDENGFGSTFYAGKIHKNVIKNSISPSGAGLTHVSEPSSPTSMGNPYFTDREFSMVLQSKSWAIEHKDEDYTLSFWAHAGNGCTIRVADYEETRFLGLIQISKDRCGSWHRVSVTFRVSVPDGNDFGIYCETEYGDAEQGYDNELYVSSPQLEKGIYISQYQATDGVLNDTDEYGAWFNRGGVGGTIQNPLLRLNHDGQGGIGTRNNSFEIKTDGSGHVAHGNISWNENGDVVFGDSVTLSWDNLDNTVKDNLVNKSITLTGKNMFSVLGDLSGDNLVYNPDSITVTIEEQNFISQASGRRWYFFNGVDWVRFENTDEKAILILPSATYWGGNDQLLIRAEADFGEETYVATHTITKSHITGYTLVIVSEQGETFRNGVCSTVLRADVYYQGRLVPSEYIEENFVFYWKKYNLPDTENEDVEWWEQNNIDRTSRSFTLNYALQGSHLYDCELRTKAGFRYDFPFELG